MAKRFKLRISRVITTFQSCRSKDPSSLPEHPVPSFFRLSPVNNKLVAVDFPLTPSPSKHQPHRSSFKRHVSSAFVSVGCGFGSKSGAQYASGDDCSGSTPEFHWEKEDKWHIVAKVYDESPRRKIYNSSVSEKSDDEIWGLPPPPSPPAADKKKRRSKKKKPTTRFRTSTSSAESGLFSSESGPEPNDDELETETLVSSSRSISGTDSQVAPRLLRRYRHRKKPARRPSTSKKRGVSKGMMCRWSTSSGAGSPECESPARLSKFKKLIPCNVEGKVKESFAVVKKSEDPYEDFKRSMMEMILEKQMFEENELEQLLQCFLSLNSRQYHGVIVEAFAEIWNAMFSINAGPGNATGATITRTSSGNRSLRYL